jgi:hypothetical protein
VRFGVRSEKGLLRLSGAGVFSYADLEANYQGLRFYRGICEDSLLVRDLATRAWRLAAPFDIARCQSVGLPRQTLGLRAPDPRRLLRGLREPRARGLAARERSAAAERIRRAARALAGQRARFPLCPKPVDGAPAAE